MKRAMEELRIQLDAVDRRLLEALRARQDLVREVGRLKAAHGEPIVQPEREQRVYQARREEGARLELDPDFVEAIWRLIHAESCRQQQRVRDALARADGLEAPGETTPATLESCLAAPPGGSPAAPAESPPTGGEPR